MSGRTLVDFLQLASETTTNRFSARVPILLFDSPFETASSCWHHGTCWRRNGSRLNAAATAQAVLAPRTPERRNGPCRVSAPYLTRSESGKGRGRRSRDALHGHVPDASSPQAASTLYYPMDVDDLPACLAGVSGSSGTPRTRWLTARWSFRRSMLLCRW